MYNLFAEEAAVLFACALWTGLRNPEAFSIALTNMFTSPGFFAKEKNPNLSLFED